jgi:hypothetical protein
MGTFSDLVRQWSEGLPPYAGFGSGIIRLNLPAAHFREQYGFWSMACACAQELGSR